MTADLGCGRGTAVEVAQIGNEVEIKATAPRTTTENRPLPVIQLEWYQAPASGDFGKTAQVLLREDVAPGEARTKRFPRPTTDVRYSVRAFQGKARSTFAAPIAYKPMVAPEPPTAVTAINTAVGIRNIPQDYQNVARVLRMNAWEYSTIIMLPAAAPGGLDARQRRRGPGLGSNRRTPKAPISAKSARLQAS